MAMTPCYGAAPAVASPKPLGRSQGDIEPIPTETSLSAITAPALLISGRHDFADFRQIAVQLAAHYPTRITSNLPGPAPNASSGSADRRRASAPAQRQGGRDEQVR